MTLDEIPDLYRLLETACEAKRPEALALARRLESAPMVDDWTVMLVEHAGEIRRWATEAHGSR